MKIYAEDNGKIVKQGSIPGPERNLNAGSDVSCTFNHMYNLKKRCDYDFTI